MGAASPPVEVLKVDMREVFAESTEIYRARLVTIGILAFCFFVPWQAVIAQIDGLAGDTIGEILGLAANGWLAGVVVKLVQDTRTVGQPDASVGKLIGSVWPRFLPLVLVAIILNVLIPVGLILLLIPGVMLALIWAVAIPAVMIESLGVFASLSRSAALTRYRRTDIFSFGVFAILALGLVGAAGGFLWMWQPVVGIAVITVGVAMLLPYLAVLSTVLYYRLVELELH